MRALAELPRDLLKEGHRIQKAASGSSMLPSIPDGTILQIEPLQQNNIRLGDIVYFIDNKKHTRIHRVSCVLRREEITFIQTWGDNSEKPDAVIRSSQVLGVVTAYKSQGEWRHLGSPTISYVKYFLKKYGCYYIKKIPGKLLSSLSHPG